MMVLIINNAPRRNRVIKWGDLGESLGAGTVDGGSSVIAKMGMYWYPRKI